MVRATVSGITDELREGAERRPKAARTPARFTEQLVALVVPDRKDRVVGLASQYEISQASVMRAVIDLGLPLLERKLAAGAIDPTALA